MSAGKCVTRHWFVLYLVLRTITGCCGELCPLPNTNCSQPGAPCVIVRDSDCSLSSRAISTSAKQYPGPVTSFHVATKYLSQYPNVGLRSRSNVELTWNIPANGTHKHLTGFEVRLWPRDSTRPYCFLFDLSGATWDFDSMLRQYSLNCISLEENQYDIQVTSLPRAHFSHMKENAVVYVGNKARMDSENACEYNSCWKSDLVIYNYPCNASMTVTFNMAPEKDKIHYYIVTLISKDSLSPDASQEIPQVPGQKTGTAKLNIPRNIARPMTERVVKLIPKGAACTRNRCLTTISKPFNIVAVDRELDCTFNPPRTLKVERRPHILTDTALGGIIAGTILFAAGCIALIVILARRSKSRQLTPARSLASSDTITISTTGSNEPLVRDNRKSRSIGGQPKGRTVQPTMPRKRVYLLYANDNNYHKNVVGLFAQFLSKVCYCDVIYDMECQHQINDSKTRWIWDAMNDCSCIVMLNSEGSYYRTIAMQNNLFYPPNDCDSCLGDMFSAAFQILQCRSPTDSLRQKLILSYFSYTSPQFRLPPTLPNVLDSKSYHLMADIEQLFCHIHDLTNGTTQLECTKYINELWYTETEQGQSLAEAIGYTESYMLANQDWFRELHGLPKPYIQGVNGSSTHPGTLRNGRCLRQCDSPGWHDSQCDTTDSMCGEIDSINSYATKNNKYDRNTHCNNNEQYLGKSISQVTDINQQRYLPQWRLSETVRPLPTKPEDTITLNSSAMGDAVDCINDSGYEAARSSIRPFYVDLSGKLDAMTAGAQPYGSVSTL